jgi:hypothetical protein
MKAGELSEYLMLEISASQLYLPPSWGYSSVG